MDKNNQQLRLLQLIEEIDGYAILLLDSEGHIESWNKGAEKIKGYTEQEILGRHFSIFFTGDERQQGLPEQLLAAAAAKKCIYNEAWRVRKNGTRFWGGVTLTALYDQQEMLSGYAKVTRDLTERMQLERHTRQHSGELEAKNREIEQFVYIASHDLQEPLLTVTNFIEFLREEYASQLDANGQLYLDYITAATERMKNLVRSLLDYSRLGIHRDKAAFDCGQLVREVLSDLDNQIKATGAVVQLGELPVVEGFATELAQLFQNLISNAIKFRQAEVSPEISVHAFDGEDGWHFEVADNGIGIDPKFGEKVFLIFQRLHDRQTYEGNGIGLAHCKKILELHGGQIAVAPRPGGGSIFKFHIPFPQQDE